MYRKFNVNQIILAHINNNSVMQIFCWSMKQNLDRAYNTLYKFDRNSTGGGIMFHVEEYNQSKLRSVELLSMKAIKLLPILPVFCRIKFEKKETA